MRTAKEVKTEIRELKDDANRRGIRIQSFMNRQDREGSRVNERLFALKLELETITRAPAGLN